MLESPSKAKSHTSSSTSRFDNVSPARRSRHPKSAHSRGASVISHERRHQPLSTGEGELDSEALTRQPLAQGPGEWFLVLDDQHPGPVAVQRIGHGTGRGVRSLVRLIADDLAGVGVDLNLPVLLTVVGLDLPAQALTFALQVRVGHLARPG